jgi:hypothetical protein
MNTKSRITGSDIAFSDCFIIYDRQNRRAWITAEHPMGVEQ